MISLFIIIGAAILLFAGAFVSKRRLGLLGLALTAGATLSTLWSYEAGLVVSATGLLPEGPVSQAVTQSLVVLLPATLLLFHGNSYKSVLPRILGSLVFTVLALAFLAEPMGYALVLEGASVDVHKLLLDYKGLIISIGVSLAVLDLFFTKPASVSENKRKR